jgi:hypothetical protein
MIRMMISKGCFFSVDLFDRFREQERAQNKDTHPRCLQDGERRDRS